MRHYVGNLHKVHEMTSRFPPLSRILFHFSLTCNCCRVVDLPVFNPNCFLLNSFSFCMWVMILRLLPKADICMCQILRGIREKTGDTKNVQLIVIHKLTGTNLWRIQQMTLNHHFNIVGGIFCRINA